MARPRNTREQTFAMSDRKYEGFRKPRRPFMERFWEKVVRDPDTDCWEWTASRNAGGYGQIMQPGGTSPRNPQRPLLAHRVAYEHIIGPIPEGLTLDHLCRNRSCVNPAHLEPVTVGENALRGTSPNAQNARKTHCKRGHALEGDNLIVRSGHGRRGRECRACRVERYQEKRAA